MRPALNIYWPETRFTVAPMKSGVDHIPEINSGNYFVRYFTSMAVVVAITAFVGCDAAIAPNVGSIRGEVTLNKQPVNNGIIAFLPIGESAGHGMAAPIKQGRYSVTLDGGQAAIGVYAVRISARHSIDQTANDSDLLDVKPIAPKDDYIPAIYNTRSKLKVTVDEPNRAYVFDFHMSQ